MKFWLFDILACPIDKFYPLTLYIFSYETKPDLIKTFIENLQTRNLDILRKEKVISIEKNNNNLLVSDDIILEKNNLSTYLQLILNSINEFNHIIDKTIDSPSKICLNLIKNEVRQEIEKFFKEQDKNKIDRILPELVFLNKIKLNIEIETGLLFCPKCIRWYPIIETIPQMLPDEFRKQEEEIKFLKSIRNLLDDEFFKQNLKPYNL